VCAVTCTQVLARAQELQINTGQIDDFTEPNSMLHAVAVIRIHHHYY
jgi:hypothetical protein